MTSSCRMLAVVVLLITGLTLSAQAPQGNVPGRDELRVRSFRLKKASPTILQEVLNELLRPSAPEVTATAPMGLWPGWPIFPGAGIAGGFNGGFGGVPPAEDPRFKGTARVVFHESKKLVIVRGTRSDLEIAEEAIALVDGDTDKPLPKVMRVRAFKLKHISSPEALTLVAELDLNLNLAAYEEMLLVVGSENLLDQVGKVIGDLDVPDKEARPAPPEN